ncbi:nucleotidyltransferase family protein [Thalassotalea sp. PLHSN55]|uniref:nucleotidyltransferase family protein n=1 Tax=Thalassotalea sp. PLHSN55 TaxID=3435888 RepID=UPI003F862506
MLQENKDKRIALVLLAAGESKRLGQPKQLIDVAGESLLTVQANSLVNTGFASHCVLGFRAKTMAQELKQLPITLHINAAFKQGLASSIAYATQQLENDYQALLFMQVDQWRLTSHDLIALINCWQNAPDKIHLCQDNDENFGPPVIFPKTYFSQLTQLSGKQGAKSIIKQAIDNCQFHSLAKAFDDIDTPQQLQKFNQQLIKTSN